MTWLVLFTMLFHAPHAQATPTFKAEKMTENAYTLFGRGGNIGVFLTPSYVVMVDDQYADVAPRIKEEVAKISAKPIRYLINTHHHGDHTGGNAFFKDLTMVISHENARPQMREDNRSEIVYAKEMKLYPDGVEFQVFHLGPGHTSGDSAVFLPSENVLHMGDLFFHKYFPYIDLGGGASTEGWLAFIDGIMARVPTDVKIIPGHGELATMDDLKRFREYLEYCRREVGRHVSAGKSEAETVAAVKNLFDEYKGVPNFTSWEGNLKVFYEELSGAK